MNTLAQHTAQPLNQDMDDDFIDLGRLFRAVMRFKWGILGLAFAITLATGLIVFSMQPVYSASASVVLESQQANVVNVEEVYTLDTYDYNYTQTQIEILKSRSLAERVVRKLQLHKHPAFLPEEGDDEEPWYRINLGALLPASKKEPPVQLTPEELEEQAIQGISGGIAGGLKISPVQYSYIMYLSFESTDRQLAAQIVNASAEEFINSNLETRLSGTLQATGGGTLNASGLSGNANTVLLADSGSGLVLDGTDYVLNAGLAVAADQTATLNGTITSDGRPPPQFGGGGAGGGIYLRCKTFAGGGGVLSAIGGNWSPSFGSGGGGGRISVWRTVDVSSGITASVSGAPSPS